MWLGASGDERTSDPIFPSARSVGGAERGWCGAAFVKAWRVCPVCKTCGSVRAVLNAHNSRYHFYEF